MTRKNANIERDKLIKNTGKEYITYWMEMPSGKREWATTDIHTFNRMKGIKEPETIRTSNGSIAIY